MKNEYVDIDTLKFLLYNVHHTEDLLSRERFSDYDKTSIDIFIDSVKTFSDNALFPFIKDMDEKPSYFKDGKINVHPQFENILKPGGEMGLVGLGFDYDDGGMQLPSTIFHAAYFIMEAANNHVPGYFGLTSGSANLILSFGNQELKDTYVPNMLDLTWGGTMCLTEPQAGSSLSDVATTAISTNEDYHLIKGQKIFISAGDHQFSSNFVHLVLARIDGAPSGIKGVSLFVVPKKRPDENGDLGHVYGYQWRSWPAPNGKHIDQITQVVEALKNNPDSRRIIVSAWNVGEIEQMALPPCHAFFQFYVADGKLSCQLYQRSADIFLGVPFNIASYALLTMMMAQVCDLEVGDFVHTLGDAHIYTNHFEQTELQLSRDCKKLPTMKINPEVKSIFDFTINDFELVNYEPHPHIKGKVAV